MASHTRAQCGMTALISAAENGRANCVRLLLDAGADKDHSDCVRANAVVVCGPCCVGAVVKMACGWETYHLHFCFSFY